MLSYIELSTMSLAHLQSYKIISTFATLYMQVATYYIMHTHALIVQWIEYRIPVPTIGVRLPMRVQKIAINGTRIID